MRRSRTTAPPGERGHDARLRCGTERRRLLPTSLPPPVANQLVSDAMHEADAIRGRVLLCLSDLIVRGPRRRRGWRRPADLGRAASNRPCAHGHSTRTFRERIRRIFALLGGQ